MVHCHFNNSRCVQGYVTFYTKPITRTFEISYDFIFRDQGVGIPLENGRPWFIPRPINGRSIIIYKPRINICSSALVSIVQES